MNGLNSSVLCIDGQFEQLCLSVLMGGLDRSFVCPDTKTLWILDLYFSTGSLDSFPM